MWNPDAESPDGTQFWTKILDEQFNISVWLRKNPDKTWDLYLQLDNHYLEGDDDGEGYEARIQDSPDIAEVFSRADDEIRKLAQRITTRFSSLQPKYPNA